MVGWCLGPKLGGKFLVQVDLGGHVMTVMICYIFL